MCTFESQKVVKHIVWRIEFKSAKSNFCTYTLTLKGEKKKNVNTWQCMYTFVRHASQQGGGYMLVDDVF